MPVGRPRKLEEEEEEEEDEDEDEEEEGCHACAEVAGGVLAGAV